MKNLFLLRHGHSDNSAQGDFERILNEEGIRKCKIVGEILQNYEIDKIYSSDSVRTKQTVESVLPFLKEEIEVVYLSSLYRCSGEELFEFIQEYSEKNILLVNHNPAISELAILINGSNDEIDKGFSPGSLALFQNNKLVSFWR
ncbi:MAG: histidine phosphatase family protein [Pseudomonadota bacterium]